MRHALLIIFDFVNVANDSLARSQLIQLALVFAPEAECFTFRCSAIFQ